MISDENIWRLLYFLFFIFFLFVHLSIIFRLIWKKKIFFGCPCSTPLYKKELFLLYFLNSVLHWTSWDDLTFFLRKSVLNCLLMSYIWLSKTQIPDIFLGAGSVRRSIVSPLLGGQRGGTSTKRFPFQFFLFNFLFSSCFLFFVYCFYILRPLQIVLLTSSCGAGRREIRGFVGGRV